MVVVFMLANAAKKLSASLCVSTPNFKTERTMTVRPFSYMEDIYMSSNKNQHVTPHPSGGWQVKGEGNSRATVRTSTQREAISVATTIAQNNRSELFVHGRNGQIRARNSYGNDPFPPKG